MGGQSQIECRLANRKFGPTRSKWINLPGGTIFEPGPRIAFKEALKEAIGPILPTRRVAPPGVCRLGYRLFRLG
ncbi:hypothetical protein Pan44_08500 [Caulifigura coniformis]|uniref:Uncharacterized protein n=1 Tax=Caulifigura coniformis TaxID=2527983 RepID=A0A517S9N1_9PLAN|nr:hypothetical protein Pan44_08500 [Caulifigura coniformis]